MEVELDALGGLDLDHEPVALADALVLAVGKQFQWRLPEGDHDLGGAAAHHLAAPQVERHALPPPVVDLQADRSEGRGLAGRRHARLIEVAAVLTSNPRPRHLAQVERPDRLEHLHLLIPDGAGVKSHRRLHRGHHQELEQVVLKHVAEHARVVVVAATTAHRHLLGHGDLHMVDVAAVPDRFENRVGEPQREDVLHRLLTEIVIDAKHLTFVEHAVQMFVEGAGRGEVGAEWLLHDDAAGAVRLDCHAVAAERRDDRLVELRRGGEVVDPRRLRGPFERVQAVSKALKVFRSADVARLVVDGLGKVAPGGIVERGALGMLGGGLAERRPPLVVGHRRPREADDPRVGRQQAVALEVVERRHELSTGEVAGRAEDHDRVGHGYSRIPVKPPST